MLGTMKIGRGIAAQQSKIAFSRQFIPQLLDSYRSLMSALSPKDGHHFAINTDTMALSTHANHAAYSVQEYVFVWPAMYQKSREHLCGIESDILPFPWTLRPNDVFGE